MLAKVSAAIGAGCCAVAAYHQEMMDQLLGVDGDDEFTIYLAPVGGEAELSWADYLWVTPEACMRRRSIHTW